MRRVTILPGVALAVLALATPAASQAPAPREGKPGGILRLVLREDLPQGFAIHDTDHFAHHPWVKHLVPHNVTYSWARRQETWIDKVASEQGR